MVFFKHNPIRTLILLGAIFLFFGFHTAQASECADNFGGTCSDSCGDPASYINLGTGQFGCLGTEKCCVGACEGGAIRAKFGSQTKCMSSAESAAGCDETVSKPLDCIAKKGAGAECCSKPKAAIAVDCKAECSKQGFGEGICTPNILGEQDEIFSNKQCKKIKSTGTSCKDSTSGYPGECMCTQTIDNSTCDPDKGDSCDVGTGTCKKSSSGTPVAGATCGQYFSCKPSGQCSKPESTYNSECASQPGTVCCGDNPTINITGTPGAGQTSAQCAAASQEGFGPFSFAGPIVPCGRKCDNPGTANINEAADCTLCHLLILVQNIFNFFRALLMIVSILLLTVAGVIYIVSTGQSSMINLAKGIMTKTLTGFALFLLAWLIVMTVLKVISFNTGALKSANFFEYTCDTTSAFNSAGTYNDVQNGVNNQKCCVLSNTPGQGAYGTKDNCKPVQSGTSKADCEKWCQDGGGDQTHIDECKGKCTDTQSQATCSQGTLTENCSTLPACGGNSSAAVGCGKVIDAASQMKQANCYYCNTFSANPHTSSRTHGADPSCQLNSCQGNPGYTDCSNFTNTAYQKASCRAPGGNAASMQSAGEAITDRNSLKAGDALATSTHVVMCESDGCNTIIHAAGTEKGLVSGAYNYMITQPGVRVVRASKYCGSCGN